MEKRIRALKAIILVVVMIVELFGVDAVRVVAETINVTGDTTISTEDNRDYAVTDCTLTVSSTGISPERCMDLVEKLSTRDPSVKLKET